ncbi:MAG: sirohydrochlorin chelatase [Pirellulales bacterium]|nr:sirohydrochlorin chelatase [Pirellulales bacterium]
MDESTNIRGLLIVGHGTRDVAGCEEFRTTARAVAARLSQFAVEPCFLELAEPTIEEAVARLAAGGVEELSVLPLLLFAAGHAKDDIPRAVEAAIASSGLVLSQPATMLSHLGCNQTLVELSHLRYEETLRRSSGQPDADTTLVMVGRGSRDEDATREMHAFAKLRSNRSGIQQTEVCFVAMAEPAIRDCLERVSKGASSRVVIQPHLLFQGQLLERIGQFVSEFSSLSPEKEWMVDRHLGPHALLEDAIVGVVTNGLPRV